MPLISYSLPNLVGGVSQQPPSIRVPNSHEEVINTWPSLVSGLQKRPGTEVVASIGPVLSGSVAGHAYTDPVSGQTFFIVVQDSSIKVFNQNGEEKTVNGSLSVPYLDFSANPRANCRMLTVGDTTFILNKEITVGSAAVAESGDRVDPTDRWTIFVSEAVANAYYTIYIDGVKRAEFLTGTNTTSETALESTSEIAAELANDLNSGAYSSTINVIAQYPDSITFDVLSNDSYPDDPSQEVASASCPGSEGTVTVNPDSTLTFTPALGFSGLTTISYTVTADTTYTVQRFSSVIALEVPSGSTVEIYEEGNAGKSLKVFNSTVKDFSDLPPHEEEGRLVKVSGDVQEAGDDYYVVFNSEGLWVETYGYGEGVTLDADTLPHTLVYDQSTDEFTLGTYTWEGRLVGNDESSPEPTFVGRTINDIFIHQGRLGVLSDENVVMSEANTYSNFWRTTVVQLLDSDPIDLAAVSGRVSILNHAIPFNRNLLLFSDQAQYIIDAGEILSPKTAVVSYTTSYAASVNQKPENVGPYVYFVDDSGSYLRLMEYYTDNNALTDNADNVSVQIPEYMTGPVRLMKGSSRINLLMVQGGDEDTLFTHNFAFGTNAKIQSSWGKWTFGGDIKFFDFVGKYVYILINYSDGLYLERLIMEEDAQRAITDFPVCLDHRVTLADCTASYDSATDTTTITTPFAYPATVTMVLAPSVDDSGIEIPMTNTTGNEYTVDGDVTSYTDALIGIPYRFYWKLSTQYVRETKGNGTVIVQDGRLSMRYLSLFYKDTSAFTVKVTLQGGREYEYPFEGRTLGSANNILGSASIDTGKFRAPIMGENSSTSIEVINDTPYHCTFTACEWSAQWRPKAVQRMP